MMLSPKIEAENIIKTLPDDTTFEDIQYHLFVAEKLRKSREQVEQGNTLTQQEVAERLAKWNIK